MKNSELRALSVDELNKKLVVEKENLEKLIFSHAATPIAVSYTHLRAHET